MFGSAARPAASPTAADQGSSHPHPNPASGAHQQASAVSSAMAVTESLAVPPKDPFRTRRQLPRTPLSSKSKSGNRSRLPGSRTRSASPGVTKIPRSSHIARSESPARNSAGLRTPAGRSSVAAAGEAAVESVKKVSTGAGTVTVTTPVADTRQVEEEMLAAFARTPKVVRTPPKSSAPPAPSGGAAASPSREEPLDELSTVQLPTLQSAGAAPAPAAGPAAGPAPQPVTALPTAPAASTSEAHEAPNVDLVGGQGAPAAEPPAEQVFGRSAKLSRTPPGGAARVDALAKSTSEEIQPPQQQHHHQQQQGLGFPQAAVHARASAAAPGAGRSAEQPPGHAAAGGAAGSPPRFASPSVSADSSSFTNAANVRSLIGSDSKTADLAGSVARRGRVGGALTPAAFEGLISAMRTPSTGMKMKRRDVLSEKLPRTPTPATVAHVQEAAATLTTEVLADTNGVPHAEGEPEAVTPVPLEADKKGKGEGEGGDSPGAVAVGDPFASRSNIPRTPTDEIVPPQLSLFQEGVGAGGGGGGDAEAMDLDGARLQIRELNQELACKRDSLAKQAEERKRLADAAFKAQDEAAVLRQRLQEVQAQIREQRQRNEQDGGGDDCLTGGNDDKGNDGNGNGESTGSGGGESGDGGELEQPLGDRGKSAAPREAGEDGDGRKGETGGSGSSSGSGSGAVELTVERVVQLEIEKWETEQGKRQAEEEAQRAAEAARQAKAALDEAQTQVRELTLSAEARHEEMLAEKLRRAREQCKEDERAIEEHQIKVKLFVADKRAQILRAQVSEEERLKAEQNVRAAAVAVAGKACTVVQEFVARNARMSRRVAGLRANVEDREKIVSQLEERSVALEASGKSCQHETEEVRELLAAATRELEAVKSSSQALEARLGPLEQECREAQTAQQNLRALVDAEEARRVSVEQRLSEVKRSGESVVGIERARRQSTERRLGLAERTRDELAAAAAAAASTALREAAAVEKSRRMSVERRLEYAERARTELSANAAESAAAAAAAAASAAAASTAASEAAALSRSNGRTEASPSRVTHPPLAAPVAPAPAAPAAVPKKKKGVRKKAVAKKSTTSKKPDSAPADGAAALDGQEGRVPASPPAEEVKVAKSKRARMVEEDDGSGFDHDHDHDSDSDKESKGKKRAPAGSTSKAVQHRSKPSPSEKRVQTAAVRAKPSGAPKAAPATTAGNGGRTRADSDSDFDGNIDAAVVPTHAVPAPAPAPTITTGRTGRKRKQINYAEPSPLLDRSVIAALSDSSDDEYDPPSPRSKKPAPVAPGQKKSRAAAAAADVAGANTAPVTKAASASTVESGKESETDQRGDEDEGGGEAKEALASKNAAPAGKGKGKGRGKAASSATAVHATAKAGSSGAAAAPREREPNEVTAGGKRASAQAAAEAVAEKLEKKRRRSTAPGKKGANTLTLAPVDAAAATGGDSVPATTSQESKKAERKSVSRASSKAKGVEKPRQDTSVPTASSEGAGAGADLLSTDLSPIAPPQNKRPRKLLGGGTSRCKTPKAKKTAAAAVAAAASSRVNGYDDDDDDGNDENAHPAAGALPPAGAGVTGVVAGAGVGPKSGSSAAAAKKAQELQRAPDSQAGEGAGSGSGGGGAAAKPAVKPLKLSTNSILARRGKSTMRTTSLFKGFLDPKNGFKAPKLKAGALRR